MRHAALMILAAAGIAAGVYSAYVYSQRPPAQSPIFNPAPNPYSNGIYANGIIESLQSNGENINIYPEVTGRITSILVSEGTKVSKGAPLLKIDDSVQRATVEQEKSQADAALAALEELKAQPRPEVLAVAKAQLENGKSELKKAQDELQKEEQTYAQAPSAITLNELDDARNNVKIAESNVQVLQKQLDLVAAGAWAYDVENQRKQYEALSKAYAAGNALLDKYTITAPEDGVVLSIGASAGSYVSPQGAYGSYTESFGPLIVMGSPQDYLEVRTYIDEILVHRLPDQSRIVARMFIRGTDITIPLEFERMQPFVSPKIELSNQRQERVDVRVLPMIFRFKKPSELKLFPGQLVDVYIGQTEGAPAIDPAK